MPEFYLVFIVLAALAMLFVVLPLMANRSAAAEDRGHVNISLYRERLALLERERAREEYSEQEFRSLKIELERHLLEDAGKAEGQGAPEPAFRPVRWLLALLVPIVALGLYGRIGALADWQITQTLDSLQQVGSEEERAERLQLLASQLSTRIEDSDNIDYSMLLARTAMELNDYPAAVDAYRRLALAAGDDPAILGQYAQALYLASDRQMTVEVKRLADQALALNPHQPTVLGMLGIDSFERGDYAQAAAYWEQLLPGLPPQSANAQMIRQGIAQARELGGQPPAVASDTAQQNSQAEVIARLEVSVSLSADLRAAPGDSVFIFARALNGPPMPLAVARLTVADLPARVVLDDSMAMTPAMKLSGFEQVEVLARVSSRGIANPGSGDFEGKVGPVSTVGDGGEVTVLIDRVLP